MSHKYDLLTVKTDSSGPHRHHPWYKERLKLKFLKTSKYSASLNGAKWRFVSTGTDDFRSGLPHTRTKMIKTKEFNPVPIIERQSPETVLKTTRSRGSSTEATQGMLLNNPGLRTLYDKVGPRQQVQLEYINAVESSLLQHPLVIYPHLEDAIPPEIIDDVVNFLDPEMNEALSASETPSPSQPDSATPTDSPSKDPLSKTAVEPSRSILLHTPVEGEEEATKKKDQSCIYKFPLIKTEAEKEQEQNLIASQQVISAKQQSRVKQVTHDLVQWAEELGGSEKSACIDEQTIKSLFGSNYESKPILMAPIQVVELTNIPPELRPDAQHSRPTSSFTTRLLNYYSYKRVGARGTDNFPWSGITIPQVVKTKYGAWYLPVGLWKPRASDQPLVDPRLDSGEAECEQAKRKLEMDAKVSVLHGAKAFKEFIISSRRGSMPTFLRAVKVQSPPATTASRRRPLSHNA